MPATGKPMIVVLGPFRIEFKQLATRPELRDGRGHRHRQFEVLWEPRLRPMLLAVKNEDITIVDDQGKPVVAAGQGAGRRDRPPRRELRGRGEL